MFVLSVIFIVSALVCYSIGVWSEKMQGILKAWHLVFFWIGFACDTSGTTLMGVMSSSFGLTIHTVTGFAAIFLMGFHAVWALIVLVRKNETAQKKFHRFSLIVWLIWLIPFFTGMFLNINTNL